MLLVRPAKLMRQVAHSERSSSMVALVFADAMSLVSEKRGLKEQEE